MAQIDRAKPGARRVAIAAVAVVSLLGAGVLFLFDAYRESLLAWVVADPSRGRITALLLIFALCLLPVLVGAAWMWSFGTRVVRGDRHPPEGTKLIQDTPVVHGAAARRHGRVYQALAGLFLFASLSMLWVLWQLWRLG